MRFTLQLGFFIVLLTSVFSCQKNEIATAPEIIEGRYNVGFLIMDGVYNTELVAPFDIFQHTIFREGIKAMNVFTIAEDKDLVKSFEGLYIKPDFSYRSGNGLPKIDILVVPSAEHHLDSDLENVEMLKFVKECAETADYIISLCDGAFVLAKAGLLDDFESTTFPGDIEKYKAMFPHLKVNSDVSFVHDGKYITSAGGAESFTAALYLSEYLYGKKVADRLAQGLVIKWNLDSVQKVIVNK